MIEPKIFKAYDIRGVYPLELSLEAAYCIGQGFAKFLREDLSPYGGSPEGRKKELPLTVAIAQDARPSSPFLAREVVRALNEAEIDVVDLGRTPTPAFYYAVASKNFAAGAMVTASHNPKEYNGFKLCGPRAMPIGENSGLKKIEEYAQGFFAAIPRDEESLGRRIRRPSLKGKLSSFDGATREYVANDLAKVDITKIRRLKIAADPGNAMGALYLEELFKAVPCDPIKINWDLNGNMPIHEPNPLKTETLQQLQAVIQNEKADFGIAPDGDGDRIGLLDEKGDVMSAAIITGLVAQSILKKNPGVKIGYDLRMSRSAREMIEDAGGVAVETPVGHSFIKKQMADENLLFAGELSMHYYLRDNFNCESPVFVIAELLQMRSQLDKPFSEIWRLHQKYAHSGEINFTVADKEAVLAKLEKKYPDGQVSRLDGVKIEFPDWWFSARASNTEPVLRLNLEALDESIMKEKLTEVRGLIQAG